MVFALDGSATGGGSKVASFTITLSTTKANDVIIVAAAISGTAATATVSSPHLTFFQRKDSGFHTAIELFSFYAIASSALSSEVITVTFNVAGKNGVAGVAFGISGAVTSGGGYSPFDSTGVVTQNGANSIPTVTVSTVNSYDFILGLEAANNKTGIAIASPFTDIANIAGGSGSTSAFVVADTGYKIVSAPQTGLVIDWASSEANDWVTIGDAIIGPVPVSEPETVAESGKAVVSEKPAGAGHVAEASSVVYSGAPKGAERAAEISSIVGTKAVLGTESLAESASTKFSQAPKGSEQLAELASVKFSQAPKGAESVAEAAATKFSQVEKASEAIQELASAKFSQADKGAESIAEASSVKYSQAPKGTASLAEVSTVKYSQAPRGAERFTEAAATIFSQAMKAVGQVKELGTTVFSQTEQGNAKISEMVKLTYSQTSKGTGQISATWALVFSQAPAAEGKLSTSSSIAIQGKVKGTASVSVKAGIIYTPPVVDPSAFNLQDLMPLAGGVKMTMVKVTVATGSSTGSAYADGLLAVKQVLSLWTSGSSQTAKLVSEPTVSGNKVSVTLSDTTGATVEILVQGY